MGAEPTIARPRRYLPIIAQLFRASVSAQAQYRFDFLLQLGMAFFWVAWNVAPVWLVFEIRPTVSGWQRPQAMLVMSTFLMLRALIEGLVSPNLTALVTHIRTGTFDFVLLKPMDAQVLVSFSKTVPAKAVDLLAGFLLSVWSINQLDPAPSAPQLVAGLVMLVSGAMTIYGIWLLISCTAFWFVKVDNLTYLFSSIFDAARWPIGVFRGWVRVALTFVVPVAVMTSYPALAVLGLLDVEPAIIAWLTALALVGASRVVWRIALGRYSSASS